MKTRKKKNQINEEIGLRGGIEVMLKNALTGEVISHSKGKNVVLYIGRNMLMTRALATATQNPLQPVVIIGSGTAATNATHTGPTAYFTFKTGGIAQTTQSGGTGQPMFALTASWESTELSAAGFNSIQEFALAFNSVSNSSAGNPYFNRYLSASAINATTSNQLLITFNVSF
jgi:hypothetical protein